MTRDARLRICSLLVIALSSRAAYAQAADSMKQTGKGRVTGVVQDSIAHTPLSAATVQLASADNPARFVRSATTDLHGRFTVADIPAGHYKIGFFHPMLDSLGVEIPPRDVEIGSNQTVLRDLAIPSAKRLRTAFCGKRAGSDSSGAVIIGVVRNARDNTPVNAATVVGAWREYSFGKTGITSRMPHLITATNDNGWFALCNVPAAGTVTLIANQGTDSTDMIEVQVPADKLLRREMFLGGHSMQGELSGIVVAESDSHPIAGALISIADGPEVRTNAGGEFSISGAPVGTRMVEVRAIGYYPDRRHVNVMRSAVPMRFALSTLKAVLDTVRVKASRLSTRDRTGFEDRRHSGVGRYVTQVDIRRRGSVQISDLFKTMSGVKIGYATDTLSTDMAIAIPLDSMSATDRRILMRGISGDWCPAAIYLDGMHFPQINADDIDGWLKPDQVAGIEVYSEATVPNEFRQERTGCGSVVIWRK